MSIAKNYKAYDFLYVDGDKTQRRMRRLEKEKEALDLRECTFSPKINKRAVITQDKNMMQIERRLA